LGSSLSCARTSLRRFGYVHFFSLSLIGFFGPAMTRWLNRDVRLRTSSTQPGIWSGFLLGFAFAFGWTPCIGPILATVLALAAASDTIARGVLLLAVYSAGLAVPFLLTALGIGQFLRFYQRFRKHLHAVELFSGALLLLSRPGFRQPPHLDGRKARLSQQHRPMAGEIADRGKMKLPLLPSSPRCEIMDTR